MLKVFIERANFFRKMVVTKEIEKLFEKCKLALGAPVVELEITDEQLCALLEMAKEDYLEAVNNWIIESQWMQLYGKNVSSIDLTFALSVRGFEQIKDFSDWFSKNINQQARGKYELKEDFISLEAGKQNYLIPKDREITKVLWIQPPTTQAALFANYYGAFDTVGMAGAYGIAGGYAGGYGGIGGYYFGQAVDVAWTATDLTYKNRLLRGDLTYSITALSTGEKVLHLYSTPGSRLTFNSTFMGGYLSLVGCKVWYYYYDTAGGDADECRSLNRDVIVSPDQIPLENVDYEMLNDPAKIIVRKLFLALAKRTLGMTRGKWSGRINIHDAEAQLDYQMLLTQAENEYNDAMKELRERLQRMHPANLIKQQGDMIESMQKIVSATPLRMIVV